jgi:RHS repeat-associated protein
MNLNGAEYFYVFNAQGDIIKLVNKSGTVVVSYVYDTWGKLISTTGTLASTVGAKNPYRYRGYRYDSETGLYYLQSRYYNPEWGRFLNADSLAGKQGVLLSHNVFAYCGNNPVVRQDPSGHCWWFFAMGVTAFAESPEGMALEQEGEALASEGLVFAETEGQAALQYASEYGIKGYSSLVQAIKGLGLQAHHIIEKRFANVLGLGSDSVALTPEEHQIFTNAWRAWFAYGKTDYQSKTEEEIWQAAQKIYENYPELLESAKKALFGE